MPSTTRPLIDPAAREPRYTGLLSIGGHAMTTSLHPTPETFHMMFGQHAFFGHSVHRSGEVFWFANVAADEADSQLVGAADWKARLRTLFAHNAGPAIDIIDVTDGELAAYPIFDMPSVRRWYDGPMIVTGDAAHATSPSAGDRAHRWRRTRSCWRFASATAARRAKLLRPTSGSDGARRPDEDARPDRAQGARPLHANRPQAVCESHGARLALPLRLRVERPLDHARRRIFLTGPPKPGTVSTGHGLAAFTVLRNPQGAP